MARQKQATPVQRRSLRSTEFIQKTGAADDDKDGHRDRRGQWRQTDSGQVSGRGEKRVGGGRINVKDLISSKPASLLELLVCIGGIYAS